MQVSFWKSILQKKIFLFDTSTEEFYPAFESGLYDNSLFLYPFVEVIFLYFKMCSLDMDIYFTRTLIFQNKGNKNESILNWSDCKCLINSPFYKTSDKCGKFGPNPSAKNGPVHFLLGAMLPCSTPFSTSAFCISMQLAARLA